MKHFHSPPHRACLSRETAKREDTQKLHFCLLRFAQHHFQQLQLLSPISALPSSRRSLSPKYQTLSGSTTMSDSSSGTAKREYPLESSFVVAN
jgi:hypothetical protein